ncbi:hypothetical protein [Anaerovibrio lipolyticus]|uniref:hypothetical protein n=1 Tax=Anaerovibrio lipolyticus TaxID=82374 RepID=UPI0026EC2A94|nr:hypothetical protein [Anaerovibrio lipolyticus]MBE6106906.1 hypothetical protein [Anaerovibrio lipolyticus]
MSETKIIGGEFKIPADVLQMDSIRSNEPVYSLGRTCFYAILEDIRKRVPNGGVLLPDYLCSSVAEIPARLGTPFKHYLVNNNFLPDMDSLRKLLAYDENWAVLLIAYFGLVDLNDTITEIRSKFPNSTIVVDDVHNFYGFGQHADYDYCFTSYRKWFPVPDGADVLKKNGSMKLSSFQERPAYVQYKAAGNLLKNHGNIIDETVALELLEKGEAMMAAEYLYRCSDVSRELFKRIDFDMVQTRRKSNAEILHEGLEKLNIRHLYDGAKTPLFVPIIVPNRDRLRKRLFSEMIFAPVHWPVESKELQGTNELYVTELSLICDQRYDGADMERILHVIKDEM